MRQPGDDDAVDDGFIDDEEELVPLGEALTKFDSGREKVRSGAVKSFDSYVSSPSYVADAEKQLVAAALADPEFTIAECESAGLRVDDLYVERYRVIWGCLLSMHLKKKQITTITLVDELNRTAKLDDVGGATFVSTLSTPGAVSWLPFVKTNADLIVEKARLRSIMRSCGSALERCGIGDKSSSIVDEVLTSLSGVAANRSSDTIADLSKVTRAVIGSMPAFGGKPAGVDTGFPDVDYFVRPAPGDLIIVAARPAMGKTAWVLDLVRSFSVRRKMPAMIFSLEMSAEQLVARMVSAQSGIEPRKMSLTQSESGKIMSAASEITSAPLFIDETPAISIGEIKSRARTVARRTPLSLIAVDYIQLVTPSRVSDNRATDVGEISAGLKAIGRELRCPVVALSQLNRSVEARNDRRPVMSDLRESGSIEQDADVVAFLYREEYYAKDRCPIDLQGVAEFIVSKNRNGPTGTAKLHFNPNLPRFDSLARP